MTTREEVEETFGGLRDLIQDDEIYNFYIDLILAEILDKELSKI